MVANNMARSCDCRDKIRVSFSCLAHDKESRSYVKSVQRFQKTWRLIRMRPIIKCQIKSRGAPRQPRYQAPTSGKRGDSEEIRLFQIGVHYVE